jgi:hypothetical protein
MVVDGQLASVTGLQETATADTSALIDEMNSHSINQTDNIIAKGMFFFLIRI